MASLRLLVVILLCVSLPSLADELDKRNQGYRTPPAASSSSHLVSPAHQIVVTARRLLRNHAAAESANDRVALALEIISLADSLRADPRVPRHAGLKTARAQLLTRLRSVKKDVQQAMRRQKRAATKKPASISRLSPASQLGDKVLAQLNQAANANARAQPANAGNAQAFPLDYGPQLVELIQRTISPASWDVNGGASTIQYWRPGMALVVRAPKNVHDELSPLLLQLRKQ